MLLEVLPPDARKKVVSDLHNPSNLFLFPSHRHHYVRPYRYIQALLHKFAKANDGGVQVSLNL